MAKKAPAEKKAPAKRGRPSEYSQEVADLICERIAEGESLRAICREESMPNKATVFRWLAAHDEFSDQYTRAREVQADELFEQIIEIADTPKIGQKTTSKATGLETTEADMIEHRRLQVDARKWALSKMLPKKYGDKLAIGGAADLPPVETTSTLNVSALPTEVLAQIMQAKDESVGS